MMIKQISVLVVVALLSVGVALASESVGSIDVTSHTAWVCHDATCTSHGIINFLPSGSQDHVTITDAGVTGYAWGDEMGWINMAPTGAGVFIDATSGELTGNAWSQSSGWINFRPSNAGALSGGIPIGVTITSQSEFYGWAWNGGPYGGWIKFDCSSGGTCVKTDWRKSGDRGTSTSSPTVPPTTSVQRLGGGYFAPYTDSSSNPVPSSDNNTPATTTISYKLSLITKSLMAGSKSTDVVTLQTFLKTDNTIYPNGLVTGYFGPATLKAVQAFQVKYRITKKGEAGYGLVGPKTKAKLNELITKYNSL